MSARLTTADRNRFYDHEYIETLKKLVDHVVLREAPIFFDLLMTASRTRMAFRERASGIRGKVREAVGPRLQSDPAKKTGKSCGRERQALTVGPAWRGQGRREPKDIPRVELASLASSLPTRLSEEEVVRAMQDRLGISAFPRRPENVWRRPHVSPTDCERRLSSQIAGRSSH